MTGKPTYKELENCVRQLEKESARQNRFQKINTTLFQISNAVNITPNMNDLFRSIHNSLSSIFDVTNFFIAIVDIKEHTLHFPYLVDTGGDEGFLSITNFNADDSLTGLVVSQRRPVLLKKKDLEKRASQNGIRGPIPLIWMGVPLIIKNEVIGVVAVQSYLDSNLYNEQDLQVLSGVSDQMAIAIDRKHAEDALRLSHEKFLTVLDSIDANIYVVDMESYKILFMNQNMITTFGRDMTGEICWENFRNESEPCKHCTNDQLIDENGKPAGLCTWQNQNPITGKWYINSDRAIEWSDGRVVRLEISTDITDLKHMEEDLQQAQRMEAIGTLAGGLAHDFNNLLFAVMGNISLAQEDLKPEIGISESLKAAEHACIKAKELTARLITFSKGGDPVKRISSIGDLLKNTVVSALSGSDIKPEISMADDIRQVNIDEGQIKQVVRNIVINAKEAMDGNGQLKVLCKNIEISEKESLGLNPGQYIKIAFEDQGCGISKANLNRIFDPYLSTKDMGADKGQGLGLTISHSIIEKHGGLITVESELGKGSTFSVYLPAVFVKEPDLQEPEGKPAAQEYVKQPATGKGKILLMDDEETIRTFLSKAINRLGYYVETCSEGKEAIEIYKKAIESKEPFDVVILDLTNKIGMGGQETMRRLLEIDHNTKGIVITGYSDDPVVANFKAYGFSGVITKPATRYELIRVIDEVVSTDK